MFKPLDWIAHPQQKVGKFHRVCMEDVTPNKSSIDRERAQVLEHLTREARDQMVEYISR